MTRGTIVVVIPVLLVAGVILFGFPDRTEDLWAWTITSPMSAMAIGGGYLAGAAFLALALRAGSFEQAVVGLIGASLLTALLLGATFLHWDRFNHDHVAFWVWTGVYLVTPAWIPYVVWRDRRTHPRTATEHGRRIPLFARVLTAAAGALQAGVALVMYVAPERLIEVWPWPLTPLTARVIASFLAFIAVIWLAYAVTDRAQVLRLPTVGALLGLVAVGVAGLRAADEFAAVPDPATTIFVVTLGGGVAGLAGLIVLSRGPAPHVPAESRESRLAGG